MKTVLVTGASGSLGQAIGVQLRKDEHCRVIITSRNEQGGAYMPLDVSNREQLAVAINREKPDLVLHLAATFVNDFEEAYAINVEATRHLLEVVKQSGYHTRVLLIGSAAEYGVVLREENPIREDRILRPVSVYGLTKAWQTQLGGLYASQGVDVVVARVFNLDGPQLSERLFVGRLQKEINEVKMGQKSRIELGSLSATRDYISTDAAAEQILAIAAHGETGQVYNVASGKPIKMRDLLDRYLEINKLDASIVHEAVNLTNRIGYDVPVIFADITKITQLMKVWRASVEA